jgi:hypothetical protein
MSGLKKCGMNYMCARILASMRKQQQFTNFLF